MKNVFILIFFILACSGLFAGSSIVGSMNGWNPADPAYDLSLNANGVWELTKNLVADSYNYKVVEGDSGADPNYPGSDQPLVLASDTDVTWKVNQDNDLVFDSEHLPIVAGDFQSEIGGTDWDQTSTQTRMVDDGTGGDVTAGDDIYTYQVVIPAGSYQCKVVLNNNWDQSTGDNVPFNSDGTTASTFTYDMSNNTTTAPSGGISQQVTVTFQVYLGNEDSTSYAGGVSVQGSVAPLNWTAGSNLLTDPDADLLYTGDVIFPIGSNPSVEFRFTKSVDGSTWDWEPYSGNRTFTINDSSTTQILEWVYWGDVVPVPQDVTITVVGSDVNLNWDAVFGATDYKIYRSTDPYSDFTLIGNTGGVTNYQDSGVGDNYRAGEYFYYVKAIDTSCESVTDIDGNIYQTIQIGNQCWMAENLKVTHYRNGDVIPNVTDSSTWSGLSTGAYCYYNNDPSNADTYGALYNWYAVDDNRGLAPEGWHVASDTEIMELEMYLGMSQSEANDTGWRGTNEGSKLAGGSDLWNNGALENDPEFGSSGFNFIPGGYRHSSSGSFYDIDSFGNLWSSTEISTGNARTRIFYYNFTKVNRGSSGQLYGFSVRCVRD